MQIFSADQVRAWDKYTIENEPVASIDLMERAARACFQWLTSQPWQDKVFRFFCGKGNNGGDGLAIARMLLQAGYQVQVHILEFGKPGTDDFQENLRRLHEIPLLQVSFMQPGIPLPEISAHDIVVDAMFGSGLNKPLSGLAADIVAHINNSGAFVVAIDVPSGMFIDQTSMGNPVVAASVTLTFQAWKLCLLVQENGPFTGRVFVLDIGLLPGFEGQSQAPVHLSDFKMMETLYRPRKAYAHKGYYGHALLVGGSYGKMGAMVLAVKSCVHTGAGLTTAFIPRCGYNILQVAVPEAMVLAGDAENHLSGLPAEAEKYSAIGIGPGMGTEPDTQQMFTYILRRYRHPVVIDADGINTLALQDLPPALPENSILTPHPKEFDRLFGSHANDFDRIHTAMRQAVSLKVIIVLKGHHTFIATPDSGNYFNATGNAGLAKGGSGDVLTGIITALLAQGYAPHAAALLGVYLHGCAADRAAEALSAETMTAGDVILFLSQAFRQFSPR